MKMLENKWALITGSSRGIGQQIALGLAQRKSNLIVHRRSESSCANTLQLLKEYSLKTHAVSGELDSLKSVEALIQQVQSAPCPMDKYTRHLAAEFHASNVLVNYLDPGWLKTDLGRPNADSKVETVLPGALLPALLQDFAPAVVSTPHRIIKC